MKKKKNTILKIFKELNRLREQESDIKHRPQVIPDKKKIYMRRKIRKENIEED